MAENSASPVKHTEAGELPDTSTLGRMEERMEADLPLLSDPLVQRWLAIVGGSVILGLGIGIFFFKRFKS